METFETKIRNKLDMLDIESNFIDYLIHINQYGEDDILTKFAFSKFLAHKFLVEEPNIIFNEHATNFNNIIAIFDDLIELDSGPEIIELNGGKGKKGRNQSRQMSRKPHKKMPKSRRQTRRVKKSPRIRSMRRAADMANYRKFIREEKNEKMRKRLSDVFIGKVDRKKLAKEITSVLTEESTPLLKTIRKFNPNNFIKNDKLNHKELKGFIRAARNNTYRRAKERKFRRLRNEVSPTYWVLMLLQVASSAIDFSNAMETATQTIQGNIPPVGDRSQTVISNSENNSTNTGQLSTIISEEPPVGNIDDPYNGKQFRHDGSLLTQYRRQPGVNLTSFRRLRDEIKAEDEQRSSLAAAAQYADGRLYNIPSYLGKYFGLIGNTTETRKIQLKQLQIAQAQINLEKELVNQIAEGEPARASLDERISNGTYPIELVRKVVTDMQYNLHQKRYASGEFQKIVKSIVKGAITYNQQQCEAKGNPEDRACKNNEIFSTEGVTDIRKVAHEVSSRILFELPHAVSKKVNPETGEVITTIHTPEVERIRELREVLINSVLDNIEGDLQREGIITRNDFEEELTIEQFSERVEGRIYDKIREKMLGVKKRVRGSASGEPRGKFLPTQAFLPTSDPYPPKVKALRTAAENIAKQMVNSIPDETKLNEAIDDYVKATLRQTKYENNIAAISNTTTYGQLYKKAIHHKLLHGYLTSTIDFLDSQANTREQVMLGEDLSKTDDVLVPEHKCPVNALPTPNQQNIGGEQKAVSCRSSNTYKDVKSPGSVMAELRNTAGITHELDLIRRKVEALSKNLTVDDINKNITKEVVSSLAEKGEFNPKSKAEDLQRFTRGTTRAVTGVVASTMQGVAEEATEKGLKAAANLALQGVDTSLYIMDSALDRLEPFLERFGQRGLEVQIVGALGLIVVVTCGKKISGAVWYGGRGAYNIASSISRLVFLAFNPYYWCNKCKHQREMVENEDRANAEEQRLLLEQRRKINAYRVPLALAPITQDDIESKKMRINSPFKQDEVNRGDILKSVVDTHEANYRRLHSQIPLPLSPITELPGDTSSISSTTSSISSTMSANRYPSPSQLTRREGEMKLTGQAQIEAQQRDDKLYDEYLRSLRSQGLSPTSNVTALRSSSLASRMHGPTAENDAARTLVNMQAPNYLEELDESFGKVEGELLTEQHRRLMSGEQDSTQEGEAAPWATAETKIQGGRKKRKNKRTKKKRRKKRTKRKRRKRNKRTRRKK